MEERVRQLFATLLNVSPETIGDETRPSGLERWDSLPPLIVVSGFEEELGIEVEPEEAAEMYRDFATFKRVVVQKLKRQG